MRTRPITLALLCCAALAVPTVALAAKGDTEVKVTSLTTNADGSGHYEGTVKSNKGKCKKKRKVTLIHLPDFVIGETKTTEEGFWQLNGPIPPTDADKVKVVVKSTKKCKKGKKTHTVGEIYDD
jgi:hypothetical protein